MSRGPSLMIALVSFLLFCLLCGQVGSCQTSPSVPRDGLCYAFLQGGDLWTACQGKHERIDLRGKALDFAISSDGLYFAIQEMEPTGIGRTKQVLVAMRSGLKETAREVAYPEFVCSTCGTIVSSDYVNRRPFDLIGSQPMTLPFAYKYFRCSSDRRVTAGITEEDETKWYNRPKTSPTYWTDGFPLRISRGGKQSEATVWQRDAFDVSPNGEYVAYVGRRKEETRPGVCVVGAEGKSSCVDYHADAISVSDRGEVLLWVGELGLTYWHPGMSKPLLLEKGTNNQPQWVTPEVAAALHKWASRRSISQSLP
jgi:hypothetical protein